VSARETCHYDAQEKEIFFEVEKKPCPDPHGNDKGGSARGNVTGSESEVRVICGDEKLVVETCGEVAYFHGNHVGGSVSRIAGAEEVETANARMDDDDAVERGAGA